MKVLLLIHGLPGAGKTTLCRRLAESRHDLYYVDLGKHPDFRQRPMIDICIDQYRLHGAGRNLLSEGYLPKMAARDKLADRMLSGCDLERAVIVGLDETDMDFLARRRNRSSGEYEALRSEVEFGSKRHAYIHYLSLPEERDSVDERVRRLSDLVSAKLAGSLPG